jgi:D-tyrosyl-tRNA(Tyr) deacylase
MPILISFLVAILQRVLSASVTVDKQLISSIGKGILVFAAVAPGDTEKDAETLAAKVLKMKLWDDDNGERVRSGLLLVGFKRLV